MNDPLVRYVDCLLSKCITLGDIDKCLAGVSFKIIRSIILLGTITSNFFSASTLSLSRRSHGVFMTRKIVIIPKLTGADIAILSDCKTVLLWWYQSLSKCQ